MKNVLITGGTGTVGKEFIRTFRDDYNFYVLGHSEKRLLEFNREFPLVPAYMCQIDNRESVFSVFGMVAPDIVIHAAAIKHVDLADKQPIIATNTNVVGSLNVIAASRRFNVPITIAISTDKASDPKSVYGYTKLIMEKCFLEENSYNKFAVCRFGNVAGSAGSVIPIWKEQAANGHPISVTDDRMRRFMFTAKEAARLINRSIEMCEAGDGGFILSRIMKAVNVIDLAKCISPNVKIVGIRQGEKINECLLNEDESKRAVAIGEFLRVGKDIVFEHAEAYTTENADCMSQEELINLIKDTPL